MARVQGEIVIERPVEVVFDYVADQRNEPTYNPRMLRSEKLTDGPVDVGTRFRAVVRSGRRPIDMLIEVTEHKRPTRFGSRTTMSSADIEGGLTFVPVGGSQSPSTDFRWGALSARSRAAAAEAGQRRPAAECTAYRRHHDPIRTTRDPQPTRCCRGPGHGPRRLTRCRARAGAR